MYFDNIFNFMFKNIYRCIQTKFVLEIHYTGIALAGLSRVQIIQKIKIKMNCESIIHCSWNTGEFKNYTWRELDDLQNTYKCNPHLKTFRETVSQRDNQGKHNSTLTRWNFNNLLVRIVENPSRTVHLIKSNKTPTSKYKQEYNNRIQ